MDLILEYAYVSSSLVMVGVIWVTQLVHYPTYNFIDDHQFIAFEQFHMKYMGRIVVPVMLIEIISLGALVLLTSFSIKNLVSLTILALIWVITFTISAPCHFRLSQGKDEKTIEKLILTNWIRTIGWTLKGVLIIV